MAAFFADPSDVDGDRLVLVDDEAHHVSVRRYRKGDTLEVIDGCGMAYDAQIETLSGKRVEARITARYPERGESPVSLHLVAAVPKGSRFDFVVEKGTEVGVHTFRPVWTERGVARPDAGGTKTARWQRVARAACKQSGRSRLPAIESPAPLVDVAQQLASTCDRLLVADPETDIGIDQAVGANVRSVALCIGPEGGFGAEERAMLTGLGARSFTWGERILRAETAAVVLSALVLHAASRTSPDKETR